ncbi:MAG: DTW domain-containing protein, partial [Thiotrichales bacterium]|nr:DTW domain-containing protein [Thiotrichales bacterium]
MARSLCFRCQRPLTHCWCACIHPVTSLVSIGVLQHPSETKIVKSSLPLLRACLNELAFWQGETIAAAAAVAPTQTSLRAWLENGRQTYLLYPPTPELGLPPVCSIESLRAAAFGTYQILLLDGTWRKAYKMLCANPELQALPRVELVSEQGCAYFIRKQKH